MTSDAPGHTARFRDIHRIYDIVEVTPGLPMPFTGPDGAAFWFTGISRAEDARNAVITARLVFADAFGARFTPRLEQTSNGPRRVYEALIDDDFTITLWAKPEHVDSAGAGEDAPERAEAAVAA